MQLDERKFMILKAIIDDYVLTGMPVGSRTISRKSGVGFSPATIRNEMSDLEELGYLDQPHTSAGRVPSHTAYRLYVDPLHIGDRSATGTGVAHPQGAAGAHHGEHGAARDRNERGHREGRGGAGAG